MFELNKLYHMDCMQAMKEIPDKYFEIAIVDPPYGRKEHGGKNHSKYVKQKNGSRIYVKHDGYANRNWDNKPAGKEYFDELMRVSKNQIIWGCNYFDYPLSGGRIIWDKCNDGSNQCGAEIAYNSMNNRVDMVRFLWRGMMQGKSIAEGTVQQGNKKLNERRIHPTQKPIALYEWIISQYAKAGDKILDTHAGSGSCCIVAHRMRHEWLGFEIDGYYFEKAQQRICQEQAYMTVYDFI